MTKQEASARQETTRKVAGLRVHEGIIRPSLVNELESFQALGKRVSSYYLDLDGRHWGDAKAIRIAIKDALKKHRERPGTTRGGA